MININDILTQAQNEIASITKNTWYLEKYMPQERTYWADIPQWIYEDFDGKENLKSLDIGCGYGTLAIFCKLLLNCDTYVINRDLSHLEPKIVEKFNINVSHIDVELEEMFYEEKFDIILLTAVLEHFNFNPTPTLNKIYDKLKDDGIFYLSVPNSRSFWNRITDYFTCIDDMPMPKKELFLDGKHHYHYTKEELIGLFEKSNFKVKKFNESYGIFNVSLSK